MKKFILILLIILLALQLSSCEKIEEKNEDASPKNSITYGVSEIPDKLNTCETSISRQLMGAVFEGLVYKNSEREIVPLLCESYSTDKSELEYTFKIRRNIYWSNGEKITSGDFVDFFKEYIDNCKNQDDINELLSIYGVKEYYSRKTEFEKTAAISSDGEYLKIRLNCKDPNFLSNLAQAKFSLRKEFTKLRNYKKNYKDLIYSGAYRIADVQDNSITLEKNRYYYNEEKGVEKIILSLQDNNEYALAGFETNKIDIMEDPPINYLEKLRSRQELVEYPYNKIKLIVFNSQEKNPFSDIQLRKDLYNYIQGLISDSEFKSKIAGTQISSFADINNNDFEKSRSIPESSLMALKSMTFLAEDNDINRELLKYLTEESRKDNLIIYYKLLQPENLTNEIKEGNYSVYLGDYNENNKVLSSVLQEATGKFGKTEEGLSGIETLNELSKGFYVVPLFKNNKMIVKKAYIEGVITDFYGDIILSNLKISETESA